MTSDEAKIQSILNANNGIITTSQVTDAGIPRRCLSTMVQSGIIQRIGRGVYASPEAWPDEMFLIQSRFAKGVFSHETSLYLHGMSDRTPMRHTMTFPFGYNTGNAKRQQIIAKLSTLENYELGIIQLTSPGGSLVRTYDIERTLCDIVKTRHNADIQVVNQAMKLYADSKDKNIAKLMDYADKLRVKPKVLNYMEVLL